jgi:ParB family chromosome partitioning protein
MTVKQLEEVVERFLSGESEREAVATATVKPIRRFFVRDVRIFVNSVRQAIDVMKKNGVSAQVEERHGETHYEFVVRIPK